MNSISFRNWLIIGAVAIVTVLSVTIFLVTPLLQPNEQDQDRNEQPDQVGVPRPQDIPMGGLDEELRLSFERAQDLATSKNFTLRLPTETLGLSLQLISELGSLIRVHYSEEAVSPNASLYGFIGDGGVLLLIQRPHAGFLESLKAGKDFVSGNPALLGQPQPEDPEPRLTLRWADGGEAFELVASANHFSMEDLVSMAESIQ